METPSGPVSQALVFLVGIISATILQSVAPAVSALVGIGALSDRRRKKHATEIAPDIAECLQKNRDFDSWVKDRAVHALKSDIAAIASSVQIMADTIKKHGEEIASVGKTSSASAADIAYIRGKLEGMK